MNIKKLTPLLFLVLLILAWYTGVSSIAGAPLEYKEHLKKAKQYEKEGRYQYAIEEYQEAVEAEPENQELYQKLIDNYKKLGDDKNLLVWCDYVIENFSDSENAYLEELAYYIAQKQVDTAAEKAKEAVKVHPKNPEIQEYYNQLKAEYSEIYASYPFISSICGNAAVVQDESGRYGLINGDGTLKVAAKYENISLYSNAEDAKEQVAAVKMDKGWYYMDENEYKAMVNEENYDFLGGISENTMSVAKKGKYGYAVWNQENRSYEVKTKLQWEYAGTMLNGVAAVCKEDKWALVNSEFKEITKYEYENILVDEFGVCCRNGIIFVKKGDQYRMVGTDGKVIGKEEFENARPFDTGELTAVCQNGKWGFADKNGEVKIKCTYEDAGAFSKYYAPVMKDGKWGYIDQKNKQVIDFTFDGAKPFSDAGIAPVKERDIWKLIQLYIYE